MGGISDAVKGPLIQIECPIVLPINFTGAESSQLSSFERTHTRPPFCDCVYEPLRMNLDLNCNIICLHASDEKKNE